MVDRERALSNLAVGDFFHAGSSNGASLICLVTSVSEGTIYARQITSQDDLKFDRNSGIDLTDSRARIDCVAPFPQEMHDAFLELDHRLRIFREMDRKGTEPDWGLCKLTAAERRALLSLDQHVSSNPI